MGTATNHPGTADEPPSTHGGYVSQTPSTLADASDSGIGRSYVGPFGAITMLLILLIIMALTVYSLVALWPPSGSSAASSFMIFGVTVSPNRDQQLFIVAGISGALGGLIHSTRSLYWYIGNRVLRRSWIAMYITLPIIGAALAIVFTLILRGGLLSGETPGGQVNFFGFSAIAALVGLFSPEAAEKLKQVFSTVLAPAESGKDSAPLSNFPVIERIDPSSATRGTIITFCGSNLQKTTAVLFHGARTTPISVSPATVTAQVPEGASTGPVSLAIDDRILTAPQILHIQSS